MFRWKDRINSLSFRFSLISCACLCILIIIFGSLVSWSFRQTIEQTLINYLSSQVDLLVAGTNIDNNGKINLDPKLELLDKTPCFWQINSNKHQQKLNNEKLLKVTAVNGDLVSFEYNSVKMIALRSTLLFPGDKKIEYIFGLPEQSISSFTKDEVKAFYFFLYSLITILTIALAVLAFIQIRFSFKPLHLIKAALRDVVAGKTSRIEGKFFSEITPLVDELNQLFDYSVKLIDRHRTFANNLAHSIKTPLSVIHNHSKAQLINEQVKIIESIINRNLARLRVAGSNNLLSARTEIAPILRVIGKNYCKLHQKEIEFALEENCFFKGDESDLYEVIGNIVENACKFAENKILITLKFTEKNHITIEDDGPGIDFSNVSLDLFSRGTRLDEAVAGTGIGLTLTKEIIDIYNGTIELATSHLGGLKVIITLK